MFFSLWDTDGAVLVYGVGVGEGHTNGLSGVVLERRNVADACGGSRQVVFARSRVLAGTPVDGLGRVFSRIRKM